MESQLVAPGGSNVNGDEKDSTYVIFLDLPMPIDPADFVTHTPGSNVCSTVELSALPVQSDVEYVL
jgi:hypothetical protein